MKNLEGPFSFAISDLLSWKACAACDVGSISLALPLSFAECVGLVTMTESLVLDGGAEIHVSFSTLGCWCAVGARGSPVFCALFVGEGAVASLLSLAVLMSRLLMMDGLQTRVLMVP